ncbi:MAG TPA: glycoside hydrolase family 95 protein [Candidatus Aminicenantes bacterium]|nr:glycoside hydrolase family 95 protein [Candidatus Aminicenantes bacterium]HRY65444.1 glycoside hydrolase family 95 protein [Candidatus Aminicenantes bacterium]HRZ72088.1 glycoside hydrolase family 95 protein [Candidatus Aminicenantes bacterium]
MSAIPVLLRCGRPRRPARRWAVPSVSSAFLLAAVLGFGACAADRSVPAGRAVAPGRDRLWYRQPAADWNEALPVGNGRLGAMVFGSPDREKLQLNEETVWAGGPIDNNNPAALESLPLVRRALFEGRYAEASALAEKHLLGRPPRIRSYQPLGDLLIDLDDVRAGTGYERWLDIRDGIAGVAAETPEAVPVRREAFASAVDDVLVIRLEAARGARIAASIRLTRARDAVTKAIGRNGLLLSGQIVDRPDPMTGPGGAHLRFAAALAVVADGGRVGPAGEGLRVEDARCLTILLAAATDYDPALLACDPGVDPAAECAGTLARARARDYRELRARHVAEHRSLYDRVALDLGGSPEAAALPTDERLARVRAGGEDAGLAALYFQYGRYLLMGSSRRPAVLPANLQGLWNQDFEAAWNSDFHTNINLQMNYWPAEAANLSECVAPLADFIGRLTVPGAVTARKTYGTRGWTLHHLTDPFGRTGVADGVWGVSPLAGPWLTFSLWDHYEFSGDTAFLRNVAYPVMKGSAEFVADFLVPSPEGWLVTAPSHSPENAYIDPRTGRPESLTYAATIDVEIARALFGNCVRAASILGLDAGFAARLKELEKRLPPLQIGKHGNVQEWIKDYDEAEPGHRHMSHMLALYPLAQITPETPELFEAARRTIARRLEHGGGQTGWSRAWIVSFYARLLEGETAHRNLLTLLRQSTLKNLFDTHPPFQIDGNFGGAAGLAEMLLQSHRGFIQVLPALPAAWADGRFRGLRARGGFEIDASWRAGRTVELRVRSKAGGRLRLADPFGGLGVRVSGADPAGALPRQGMIELETRPGQEIVYSTTISSAKIQDLPPAP